MKYLKYIIIISVFIYACKSENTTNDTTDENGIESDTIEKNVVAEDIDNVEPDITIEDFIFQEYSNYLEEENAWIDPAQTIFIKSGTMICRYDIYEGGNGEGDEGIILVCSIDDSGYVIDHVELSNGFFGDVTEVWSVIELIPENYVCIYTEEHGLENAEMDENGYFTGDPYSESIYSLITIDESGYFSEQESQSESITVQDNYLANKDDILVKTVRKYYGIVEQKASDGSFGSYPYRVGENETYEYFFDASPFNKIIHKKTDGAGTLFIDQYYFIANELFFVYTVNNEKVTENRYYYHNNQLKVALEGKDKNPLSEDDIKKSDFYTKKVDEIKDIRSTIVSQMD